MLIVFFWENKNYVIEIDFVMYTKNLDTNTSTSKAIDVHKQTNVMQPLIVRDKITSIAVVGLSLQVLKKKTNETLTTAAQILSSHRLVRRNNPVETDSQSQHKITGRRTSTAGGSRARDDSSATKYLTVHRRRLADTIRRIGLPVESTPLNDYDGSPR